MTDRIKASTSQLLGGQPGSGRLGADQRAGSARASRGHAALRRRVGTQQAVLRPGRGARASSGHAAVQRPAGTEQRAPRRGRITQVAHRRPAGTLEVCSALGCPEARWGCPGALGRPVGAPGLGCT